MMETVKEQRPTPRTYQLLYAKSGNRCAYPGCPMPISDGQTLFGEAAHIKAENPSGPRYDANQTSEERRHFDNLILLCGVHHKCVDADAIAFSVEHLQKMKREHEAKSGKIDDEEVKRVTDLFVAGNVTVTAVNPYNSVTAGVFHQNITNIYGPEPRHQEVAQPYLGVLPKAGVGRFRAKDKPLGQTQSIMPFDMGSSSDILLGDGPCFWFRMLPSQAPTGEWTFRDLEVAAGHYAVRLETIRGMTDYRFRSNDGIGRYLSIDPGIAYSATFLFRTGELWSVDTKLCVNYGQKLFALSEVRKKLGRLATLFSETLVALGVPTPYRWIVGIEDVEGFGLAFDRRNGHQDAHTPILVNRVISQGLFSPGDDVAAIVDAFSRNVFAECAQDQPPDII